VYNRPIQPSRPKNQPELNGVDSPCDDEDCFDAGSGMDALVTDESIITRMIEPDEITESPVMRTSTPVWPVRRDPPVVSTTNEFLNSTTSTTTTTTTSTTTPTPTRRTTEPTRPNRRTNYNQRPTIYPNSFPLPATPRVRLRPTPSKNLNKIWLEQKEMDRMREQDGKNLPNKRRICDNSIYLRFFRLI